MLGTNVLLALKIPALKFWKAELPTNVAYE
jgi:hypothetical protein